MLFPGSDQLIMTDGNNQCYNLNWIYILDLNPPGNLIKQNTVTHKLQTAGIWV